jgi:hypothetical protein
MQVGANTTMAASSQGSGGQGSGFNERSTFSKQHNQFLE